MKRFQQVRSVADPKRYGQVAWVEDRHEMPETGPLWPIHIQWAGEDGLVRGCRLSEVRPETFREFCFERGWDFGKAKNGKMLFAIINGASLGCLIGGEWVGAALVLGVSGLFTLFTWGNFHTWRMFR